ncbi:MAG: acetyl-CoA carboxylase, carboxyltransferase subunit beta [Nitrospinota bacterium]|nr:acetyl-CoA carboxylase, carboxyltransferase subunit beta [Nitrospinota bacterium]
MSWLDKFKTGIGKKIPKPEKIWVECPMCNQNNLGSELRKNLFICPQCNHHLRMEALDRIHSILEPNSFIQHDQGLISSDPLKFKDKKKYKDRIKSSLKKTSSSDAILTGSGLLDEHRVEVCIFQFDFMGGSMGSVVGEKITRSIERAMQNRTPLIIFSCSGGARMQEGILSLMQMAKTSSALQQLAERKIPYISILTDPTMGGVSASFAMLGDIIIAEPGALIGFAGPRVIKQTIQQTLPEGFQTAEFLLENGLIDNVVHRRDLKATLAKLLALLKISDET